MLREMKEEDFIVSKTDLKGRITYCNQIFMDMAEYTEEELLGKAHSIIRHPEMPKAVFRYLWETIPKKEEVFAYVLNKTKTITATGFMPTSRQHLMIVAISWTTTR